MQKDSLLTGTVRKDLIPMILFFVLCVTVVLYQKWHNFIKVVENWKKNDSNGVQKQHGLNEDHSRNAFTKIIDMFLLSMLICWYRNSIPCWVHKVRIVGLDKIWIKLRPPVCQLCICIPHKQMLFWFRLLSQNYFVRHFAYNLLQKYTHTHTWMILMFS